MRNMHPRKSGSGRRPQDESNEHHKKPYATLLRDFSGAKSARKADAGVLTLRHPSGIVAQTFREMQQRNFNQGANK